MGSGTILAVKELMGSGRLRTEEQKRGTKYFAGGKAVGAKVLGGRRARHRPGRLRSGMR